MNNNLNLYVWEDVLSDYTDGIMFALAESKEEAIGILLEKAGNYKQIVQSGKWLCMKGELEKNEPKVYYDRVGFFVFGGG